MQSDSATMTEPLDWPGLVDEALSRRRAERLTQKEHAALAGVSVPTMIAFDRKQTRLSFAKALDILRVVGLVAEPSSSNDQDAFVKAAEQRWAELVSRLPDDAVARQPHGHYAFDYEIAGASVGSARTLLEALRQADHGYTGWPPFWVPTRKAIAPYPFDRGVECWLGQPEAERALIDAAHSNFWRAALDARLYLRRGYQEDGADVLTPGTVFDLTLPVWRVGEAMLHAHHLAQAIEVQPNAQVQFRVHFAGLAGRELKSWANPYRDVIDTHRCRILEATEAVSCQAGDIDERLPNLVHALLSPVYERFDFFQLPTGLVQEELGKLGKDRSRRGSSR